MYTNLTIKAWAEDDRPREKMLLKGKLALTDAELIAILIGSGTRSKSAVQLAQEILHSCKNNLQEFGKWTVNDLQQFNGIGQAKAVTLLAAIELGRRRKATEGIAKKKITSAQQVFEHLSPYFMDLQHEEFYIILLSRANTILGTKRISVGGMTGTIADGKIIFKEALAINACGIILAHNHPSGQLTASEQDKKLTSELIKFGKMIDLQIIDHLIFANNQFFSFAENGLM